MGRPTVPAARPHHPVPRVLAHGLSASVGRGYASCQPCCNSPNDPLFVQIHRRSETRRCLPGCSLGRWGREKDAVFCFFCFLFSRGAGRAPGAWPPKPCSARSGGRLPRLRPLPALSPERRARARSPSNEKTRSRLNPPKVFRGLLESGGASGLGGGACGPVRPYGPTQACGSSWLQFPEFSEHVSGR